MKFLSTLPTSVCLDISYFVSISADTIPTRSSNKKACKCYLPIGLLGLPPVSTGVNVAANNSSSVWIKFDVFLVSYLCYRVLLFTRIKNRFIGWLFSQFLFVWICSKNNVKCNLNLSIVSPQINNLFGSSTRITISTDIRPSKVSIQI